MSHSLFLANELHIECDGVIADEAVFFPKVSLFTLERVKYKKYNKRREKSQCKNEQKPALPVPLYVVSH